MSAMEADIKFEPSSQSHFAKFKKFTPDDAAPFENEFARLAASQDWIPGSQQYTKERTIALRAELTTHYFPSSQPAKQETTSEEEPEKPAPARLSKEEILDGYRALCDEVGLPHYDSIGRSKRELKRTLVNIVNLIDARRTGEKVMVWQDFNAFRAYTLQEGFTIDKEEAKKDGGHLASLLQRLVGRGAGIRNGKRPPEVIKRETISGRVTKRGRK